MKKTLRYVMYLRKSTDSEDRQKASIPAQRAELEALAKRRELVVVEEFAESRSAKRPGRPAFADMMALLNDGKADAILCWHLDRLARNAVDGAAISWALTENVVQEILTPVDSYTGRGDDKLILNIKFGIAEKYSDDLSANVKRGQRQALHDGYWPSKPPLGYIRAQVGSLELKPDPERFDLVKDLWRLRRLGTPMQEILHRSHRSGLTTPKSRTIGGRPLSASQLYRLLENPFYAGVMRYQGEEHPGRHEAMITWQEFEEVQAVRDANRCITPRPANRIGFLYRGLFTCGSCGAQVTPERTVNRHGRTYIHYHCCRKNRRYRYCPERSVQEPEITDKLLKALEGLQIPAEVFEEVRQRLAKDEASTAADRDQRLRALQRERGQIRSRSERLIKICEEGGISADELRQRRHDLQGDERRITEQIGKLGKGSSLLEPFDSLVSSLNEAKSRFESGSDEQKRDLLRLLFSNLEIKSRTVLSKPKKVVELLASSASSPSWLGSYCEFRSELEVWYSEQK